jgi:EAL domain-containing protein (putative c-di-GMP-specific phosphodiesterase class I)
MRPSDISFDVTEATLAKATLMHREILTELRDLGVRIAIAEFGSEYSSLNYLRTYRVSHLKIAQSFIDAAVNDTERANTMRAIVNFAHELGIGVLAQGVETAEQRELSSASSTIAQGWFFGKAMGAQEVTELLRVGRIDPLTGGRAIAVAARDDNAPNDDPPVPPCAAASGDR